MCFKLLSNTNCADITQFCKDEASVCTFALADGALDYCPVYCAAQPL